VDVRDDVSVEGRFWKVRKRRVHRSFPHVLKRNLGLAMKGFM
jgi:hypothetical protein